MTDNSESQGGLLTRALTNTLAPKTVKGLWFEDRELSLDGYEFVECRFDSCRLHVNNAQNVTLQRCYISKDTHFIYGQSALSAIKLFNLKTDWYYENAAVYVPERDEKGRITLNNSLQNTLADLLRPKNE